MAKISLFKDFTASKCPSIERAKSGLNLVAQAGQEIEPSEFQRRILECPVDLVLPGGRGGGKSFGVCIRIANLVKKYGEDYQGLYIRKTYKGVQDFERICRKVFRATHPRASYNKTNKLWSFDNGATLELNQLEHEGDYDKFQGRSFTEIIVDETGQYSSPQILDLMLSNLRAKAGIPLLRTIIANPGGVGHGWILQRYIQNRIDGEIYEEPETERKVVTLNSTYLDNPAIDRDGYLQSLRNATANDEELRKAYVEGDWNIARGAFFSSVLEKERSMFKPWQALPKDWMAFIGCDYGTAAPCAIYAAALSPGATHQGMYYPRNSVVLFDELYLAQTRDLSKGLNLTVPEQAERIKQFCQRWNISPMSAHNVADDACFTEDGRESIGNLFLRCGVRFKPAKKGDRISGWEHLRTLMRQSGSELPGLYVAENCRAFWQIMPSIPRDDKHGWDVDTRSNDHIADAVRYIALVTRKAPQVPGIAIWG